MVQNTNRSLINNLGRYPISCVYLGSTVHITKWKLCSIFPHLGRYYSSSSEPYKCTSVLHHFTNYVPVSSYWLPYILVMYSYECPSPSANYQLDYILILSFNILREIVYQFNSQDVFCNYVCYISVRKSWTPLLYHYLTIVIEDIL